jgi:Membrane-associated lipoprotein involved in thiamine biosynthesis
MKFASSEARRARPLLGTFVDITARGADETDLHHAIDLAFATIQRVDRLMSFHDPGSDVWRINRDGFPKGVIVHPWTWRVLTCAQEFSRKSNGVFDITIGRQLVKWDYLPKVGKRFGRGGSWRDIVLDNKRNVQFHRPLIVDLGGIAKGFAVDRAVEALKNNGVKAGIVNAGGDLRAFGSASQFVHLRHPAWPTRIAGAVRLRERAMATSGVYFERRKYRGKYVGPLLDGRTGQSGRDLISVSVAAAECMVADALTKILFTLREKAADLLAQYHADALLLERDGAPSWIFHSLCDTPDRIRFA